MNESRVRSETMYEANVAENKPAETGQSAKSKVAKDNLAEIKAIDGGSPTPAGKDKRKIAPAGEAANPFVKDIEPFLYGRPITYVDVGAHVGGVFDALTRSSVRVREAHLIEPNPKTFGVLQEAFAKVASVSCHNVAIGAKRGTVAMRDEGTMTHVVAATGGNELSGIAARTFKAEAITLDDLAGLCQISHIALLKVDVEGHELAVFEGARQLLETESVDIVYVEAGVNPNSTQQTYYRAIEDVLRGYGYRLFRIYEQAHEWLDDSPLLRRVNLAFMSASFVAKNPYRTTLELFDLRIREVELTARVATVESELAAGTALRADLEQTVSALEGTLAETKRTVQTLVAEKDAQASEIVALEEERERVEAETEQMIEALVAEKDAQAEEIAALKKCGKTAENAHNATTRQLITERDAFVKYADQLEKKYLSILQSRSWKMTRPARTLKKVLSGKTPSASQTARKPPPVTSLPMPPTPSKAQGQNPPRKSSSRNKRRQASHSEHLRRQFRDS
jgi:FkbM family methyltransferase